MTADVAWLHRPVQAVLSTLTEVAATLASLNLVFLGIVYSAFQANRDVRKTANPRRYRNLALASLGSFIVGVLTVAVATVGLLAPPGAPVLLPLTAVLFFGQLVALVALAVHAVGAIR